MGGGGGQPHLHGDPFGTWCLYSALNYSSSFVHPPQIGWAFDGPSIYGRHLSPNNEGYSVSLDSCGGHVHDFYAYHYHAQVLTSTTDSGAYPGPPRQAAGQIYYASTTGPYKCLKGDISLITNYWGKQLTSHTSVIPDTTQHMCSGTTEYYTAKGITIGPALQTTAKPSFRPTSTPTQSQSNLPSSAQTPTLLIGMIATTGDIPSMSPTSSPSVVPSMSPTSCPSIVPSTSPILSHLLCQV